MRWCSGREAGSLLTQQWDDPEQDLSGVSDFSSSQIRILLPGPPQGSIGGSNEITFVGTLSIICKILFQSN